MKRFIAIEDDNSPAYTQAEIHAEVLPDVNSAFAEVLNTHNDLVESIDVAHRGQEVAETLTTVADGLTQPGVTSGGMGAVEVAVEELLQSIGYRSKMFSAAHKALPVEERRGLAVESIREKVGDIWHRLSMFMKMVMDKIKAFFESIFNFDQIVKVRAGMLKKKAAALFKEKAQLTAMDLKNKAGQDVLYENNAFGLFAVGTNKQGLVDTHEIDLTGSDPKVFSKIESIWDQVDKYVADADRAIKEVGEFYKRFEAMVPMSGEELDKSLIALGKSFLTEYNTANGVTIKPLPFGRKYLEIKVAPGYSLDDVDKTRGAIGSIRITTQQASDDNRHDPIMRAIGAQSLSNIPGLCDTIIQMVDKNSQVRKLLSGIEQASHQADHMARQTFNSKGDGAYKLKQFASTLTHTHVKIQLTIIREYYEMACRIHRLLLGYVAWCLSQYSKL